MATTESGPAEELAISVFRSTCFGVLAFGVAVIAYVLSH